MEVEAESYVCSDLMTVNGCDVRFSGSLVRDAVHILKIENKKIVECRCT